MKDKLIYREALFSLGCRRKGNALIKLKLKKNIHIIRVTTIKIHCKNVLFCTNVKKHINIVFDIVYNVDFFS